MNRCLDEENILIWLTKGKIILIQEDSQKGTILSNYRPITCLPMMCNIIRAHIREEIYY